VLTTVVTANVLVGVEVEVAVWVTNSTTTGAPTVTSSSIFKAVVDKVYTLAGCITPFI
jgi:hypothetical protein